GVGRHRPADPDHAGEPARRAAQALRGDRALQGAVGDGGHPEVSRAGGPQPVRQHHRLHAALHRLGQHHRVAGPGAADGGTAAAQGPHRPGHVPGRNDRAAAGGHDRARHPDLRHRPRRHRSADPARGDLMAWSDVALDPTSAPVEGPGPAVAAKEQRVFVASQWQLMWWRFRKHKVAVASAVVVMGFYLAVIGADFLAYSDPNASEAQRSLMPPQRIYWFDGWRFSPHVHALKGARDPQTFKRVYKADPSQKIPIRFFARGFEYYVLGVIPASRHLIGVDEGLDASKTIFLLGTDVQGRDMWSRLMF